MCLAAFQQAGCGQRNHSECRSDNTAAPCSQMLPHSSPLATGEVLEGKDRWTTPLTVGMGDEMSPVQREVSLSEVELSTSDVTEMASAGQMMNL